MIFYSQDYFIYLYKHFDNEYIQLHLQTTFLELNRQSFIENNFILVGKLLNLNFILKTFRINDNYKYLNMYTDKKIKRIV